MDVKCIDEWKPFFQNIYCRFLEKFRSKTILFLFISYILIGIPYLFRLVNNININVIDLLTYPFFFGFVPLQLSFIFYSMFRDLNINIFKYMQNTETNISFCINIKNLFKFKYYILGVLLYTIPSHIPISLNDINLTYAIVKISLFPGVFFIGIPIWYFFIYSVWLRKIVNVDIILDAYIIHQISNLITNFLSKISILLMISGLIASGYWLIFVPSITTVTPESVYGITWLLLILLLWFYQVYYMHNLITILRNKINNNILKDLTPLINENELNIYDQKDESQKNLKFIKLYLMHEIIDKLKDPIVDVKLFAQYLIGAFIPSIISLFYKFLQKMNLF